MLGVTAEGLQSFHHDKPVRTCHTVARPDLYFLWPGRLVIVIEFDENNHTDRTTKSDTVQKCSTCRSSRIGPATSTADTHGRRVRSSRVLRVPQRGCRTGNPKGRKCAFLPCMDQVSKIVAPWIVAGQGKGEFPEACL